MTSSQPTLPGLAQPAPSASQLELAAHRQLQALSERGLLTDAHAITAQLVRDLAAVIGQSCRTGKAAAAALASKQLLDALALLPPLPVEGDPFDQLLRSLEEPAA